MKYPFVISAQAGMQCVKRCEASKFKPFGPRYSLGPSFASSRFALCLLGPLCWDDDVGASSFIDD